MDYLWNQAAADEHIPEEMQGALKRWVCNGIPPGGFLTAVLTNDLFEAVGRADHKNIVFIPNYCAFLWNFAPAGCFGSAEKFDRWQAMHRENLNQGEQSGA